MLRVLIVDDEPPARARLCTLLKPFIADKRIEIIGQAGDGVEALQHLAATPTDLIFLDIQMPEMDGFEVLERVPPQNRPVVIFTTAFDAYALRAFEAHAIDYLLKPIDKDRLAEAVDRAERLRGAPARRQDNDDRLNKLLDWIDAQAEPEAPPVPTAPEEYAQQLSVPYRDRILIIPVEHLVSAEINEGITRLYILDENQPAGRPRLRQYIVSYTLEQLESLLDPRAFLRVHRSTLVRFDQIQELIPWFSGRYKLVLNGNHEVVASRERSKLLKERLRL